jgi:F-type H+-transporting ATPase subunit f
MHASLIRRNLSGLVPPKIASPSILVECLLRPCRPPLLIYSFVQSAGKGADLTPLVAFYSKLPKGPAPESAGRGIKARYFNGKNASASPIVVTMLAIFGLGYTIDYQSACCVFFSTLIDGVSNTHVPIASRIAVHLSTCDFFLSVEPVLTFPVLAQSITRTTPIKVM